jgi:hypothetical protein
MFRKILCYFVAKFLDIRLRNFGKISRYTKVTFVIVKFNIDPRHEDLLIVVHYNPAAESIFIRTAGREWA